MSRFVEIDADLINVDHIVRVHINHDATLSIQLDSGESIEVDHSHERYLNEIAGRDFIVAAVPCEGVYAIYEYGGKEFRYPIHQFGVTANGEVRPLCQHFYVTEFHDKRPGFRGMTDSPAAKRTATEPAELSERPSKGLFKRSLRSSFDPGDP